MPFAAPPIRAEVGAAAPVAADAPTAVQLAVGTHLASGSRRDDQSFDVGAGYLVARTSPEDVAHGFYVDGARLVDRTAHRRTWLGARLEALWAPAGGALSRMMGGTAEAAPGAGRSAAMGARLRIDHEFFGTGTTDIDGSDRCGVMAGAASGTVAIGVYAEAGPQWIPGGAVAWAASAGLTVRLPTIAGVYFGLPWCK